MFLEASVAKCIFPIGDKNYQGIAAFCVCVLECVAHIIHILIMTNIGLIFQMETWNWSPKNLVRNFHQPNCPSYAK